MIGSLVTYRDREGRWRWTRYNRLGELVGTSRLGFALEGACVAHAETTAVRDRWSININIDEKWYWHVCTASNLNLTASTEYFFTRAECVEDARRFGYDGS